MATVLYAWELGANLGHLVPLAGIEQKLREDGHRAVFAVSDLVLAEAVLGRDAMVLQAPAWPRHRHFGAHGGGFASFADVLAAIGFGDPDKLSAMIGAWSYLVELVRPDVVVADYAPGLLVALHGRSIPAVAVGSGFSMPPLLAAGFPPLRGDRGAAIPEARLLQALRAAEEARGRVATGTLIEPFRTRGRAVFGVPELDPYRSFRNEPVAMPPGGLPGALPWPSEPRLFAYLGTDTPRIEALAQALSLVRMPVEAYLRGDRGPISEFLRLRGVTVHETRPPLSTVLPRASHILTEGGAMTAAAAFTAGRPQLVMPPHAEAELTLALLEQQGVGRRLTPDDDPKALAEAIDAFVADAALAERAEETARRLSARVLPDGAEVAAAEVRAALA